MRRGEQFHVGRQALTKDDKYVYVLTVDRSRLKPITRTDTVIMTADFR